MSETLYLPINVVTNRILNADEVTLRRRIEIRQGESYEVFLNFLSGASEVTPDITNFSFILRSPAPSSVDLLTGSAIEAGSGAYPWKFSFSADSLPLNHYVSGHRFRDTYSQIVWTQGTGELEVIAPVLTRVVAASTELTGNFSYVSSINGEEGALTFAGAGTVTLSQAGTAFTISGAETDLSDHATTEALAATGANIQAQISNLSNHTGDYYPRTNPSGFITGVDLSAYATIAALNSTGSTLQAEIATLSAQTGSYYPRSNPSGFITGVDLSLYATNSAMIATGSNLQAQVSALAAATGAFATAASLGATGATLQVEIDTLIASTGSFYPRSNPSGFITGVDLSSYATTAALSSASGALQGQISTLNAATGSYATNAALIATGSGLQTQIAELQGPTGSYYHTVRELDRYLQSGKARRLLTYIKPHPAYLIGAQWVGAPERLGITHHSAPFHIAMASVPSLKNTSTRVNSSGSS
jgi:hypothetical protein